MLIVVSAFAFVLVGSFLSLAYIAVRPNADGTHTQILLTMFTTVVSFIAGIFVESPRNGNGSPDASQKG